MSEQTIWIVTSGEYSDYYVHLAFAGDDAKLRARQYAAQQSSLTFEEYEQLERFWEAHYVMERYHAEFAKLPEKIRKASYKDWRVDKRVVFDVASLDELPDWTTREKAY